MLRKFLVLILVLVFVSQSHLAQADMFGAADSKMILQLAEMLKSMKKQLDQLKKTQQTMDDIKNLQNLRKLSSNDIINGRMNSVFREAGVDLTNISTAKSKTDKVNAIHKSLGSLSDLLSKTDDAAKRDQIRVEQGYLQRQLTLAKLSDSFQESTAKTTKRLSEEDSIRTTAQATNTMAMLAVEAQKQRNADQAAKAASLNDEKAILKSNASVFKALSKSQKNNDG